MSENEKQWKRPVGFVWTIEDLARELKISVRNVYRLTSQDKIPFSKIGKSVRFSPDQIEEWLRRGGTK
ncbi:MAG: helix-turn-helix domain-containing protein [Deltaproteobacteria bacterium]|nr:helix-turn-helix domain-containing protein [Deltaproteobacteria bacterium]MBI3294020.1 helix-turn-helix domain-containing protein [Deltaproteobacteria bacterium]